MNKKELSDRLDSIFEDSLLRAEANLLLQVEEIKRTKARIAALEAKIRGEAMKKETRLPEPPGTVLRQLLEYKRLEKKGQTALAEYLLRLVQARTIRRLEQFRRKRLRGG